MISDFKIFTEPEIAQLEQKKLNEYWNSDNPLMGDALKYYLPIFFEYLHNKASSSFTNLKEEQQQKVLDELAKRFNYAMSYAFNKGHQDTYHLILINTKQKIIFTKDFFAKPINRTKFLNDFFASINPDDIQEKLYKDAIYVLVNFTRKYFVRNFDKIMELARIFFTKGAGIAFDQIRTDLLKENYIITGYSDLLNAPYNQSFAITPAFVATYDVQHPGTETWDVRWDETYGAEAQKYLVGKVFVNAFTPNEIRDLANKDAETYQAIAENLDMNGMSKVYQAQLVFVVPRVSSGTRILTAQEYKQINIALRDTLCRRLKITPNQIFVRS